MWFMGGACVHVLSAWSQEGLESELIMPVWPTKSKRTSLSENSRQQGLSEFFVLQETQIRLHDSTGRGQWKFLEHL